MATAYILDLQAAFPSCACHHAAGPTASPNPWRDRVLALERDLKELQEQYDSEKLGAFRHLISYGRVHVRVMYIKKPLVCAGHLLPWAVPLSTLGMFDPSGRKCTSKGRSWDCMNAYLNWLLARDVRWLVRPTGATRIAVDSRVSTMMITRTANGRRLRPLKQT